MGGGAGREEKEVFEGGTRRGLRLGDQAGQGLDLRGEMGKRRVGRRRGQNG